MTNDVVIVGGGVGGAVLAEMLARGGRRVTVLERATGPPPFLRPEILWPASARTLFALAPESAWRERAILPLREIRMHDGERFAPIVTAEVMAAAEAQPWFTNPNETREALLRLASYDLRRGMEVTEVIRENGRIAAVKAHGRDAAPPARETEFAGAWIVGDDGAHSRVREACGIRIDLQPFPVDFFCAALESWPERLPRGVVHLWPNWGGSESGILACGAGSLPDGGGVALVLGDGRALAANPDPAAAWKRFRAIDADLAALTEATPFPEGFFRIVREWGHAERYGAPGALLLGDAAHPVSPAGGQGANMAIADAAVLAELLLASPRAGRDEDLIAAYERRRRTANARSLRPTRAASRFFGLPPWTAPTVLRRGLVHWLARHPRTVARILRSVSTLFTE